MNRYLVIIILVMFNSPVKGNTQNDGKACRIHFADREHKEDEISGLLRKIKPAAFVRICTSKDNNKAYYIGSAVASKNNVAYYYLRRIFNPENWSYSPPESLRHITTKTLYMCSGKHCQTPDSEGFVFVQGLSTGLFQVFIATWRELRLYEVLFNNHTKNIKFVNEANLAFLKSKLPDKETPLKPKIWSIKYVVESSDQSPHFVSNIQIGKAFWTIEFDYSFEGITFLKIVQQ